MRTEKLLIVDDDQWLLESMSDWLGSEGFSVLTAKSFAAAKLALSNSEFDLILCDVRLDDEDGFAVLRLVKKQCPHIPLVLISGYASPESGAEAVAAGAFDFLTKPVIDQELLFAIRRALDQRKVSEENEQLKAQLDRRFGLEGILSHDPKMIEIFDTIDRVADARANILITGENGTGKSMIARAIHGRSNRRKKPFVEVACGALPDNLLESELFGHVAGAFTGATTNKIGKFKQSDGGSLFLDEIGTASPALQVKLLRAIQELQFEPLGGLETITVDTRLVLATNEDLERAVTEGRFRQDLYYRINVIHFELPSLRQRVDDIPILVEHFLQVAAKEFQRTIEGFTPAAMSALQQHTWPGNIRELENVIQRAVLLTKRPLIDVEQLPLNMQIQLSHNAPSISIPSTSSLTLDEALQGPERQLILQALRANHWNRIVTAAQLGINRTTLYKKMKRLGLEESLLSSSALA